MYYVKLMEIWVKIPSEKHCFVHNIDDMRMYRCFEVRLSVSTDEYDAIKLVWLPKELPRHVRLVVSTLAVHDTYKPLKAALPADQFVEVGALVQEDAARYHRRPVQVPARLFHPEPARSACAWPSARRSSGRR